MKTIVFIGTNKSGSSYEAIKASESMNYYTVLLTQRQTFVDKRLEFPNVHLMVQCDLDNIYEVRYAINQLIAKRLNIQAIVSFIDPYCYTAALLAREYGLKCFSEEAIAIMQDKIKSRVILNGSSFAPFFHTIRDDNILTPDAVEEKLPLVIKSSMSTASKDVRMVRTYQQYEKAISQLGRRYPNTPILIEKFLEGPQYLVETVTIDGNINVLAIIEQEVTFTGRFIITGYKMITDHESGFCNSLKAAVKSIIHMHGMQDGPCHLELRHVGNEWKLIEANPRIAGGAMNLFIETAYGLNIAKETLKLTLGQKPDFDYKYKRETFLQYVVVPSEGMLIKVTGKNIAQSSPGVRHVYVKPKKGSILIPPISMGYRYAYVIAVGKTADEARNNAKMGSSEIKFHMRAIDDETFKISGTERSALLEMGNKYGKIEGLDAFSNNVVFET